MSTSIPKIISDPASALQIYHYFKEKDFQMPQKSRVLLDECIHYNPFTNQIYLGPLFVEGIVAHELGPLKL